MPGTENSSGQIDTLLLGVAVALAGVGDAVLTVSFWHLESNPLVTSLGVGSWIGVKTALVVCMVVSSRLARGHPRRRYLLATWASLGVFAVVGNLFALALTPTA